MDYTSKPDEIIGILDNIGFCIFKNPEWKEKSDKELRNYLYGRGFINGFTPDDEIAIEINEYMHSNIGTIQYMIYQIFKSYNVKLSIAEMDSDHCHEVEYTGGFDNLRKILLKTDETELDNILFKLMVVKSTLELFNAHNKITTMNSNKLKCTIGQLFTWYSDDKDWHKDWQITNVMDCSLMNNSYIHCQEDGENGMSHLRFLKENENVEIEVESIINHCNDYDNIFSIKDRKYILQSTIKALSTFD